MRRGVVRSGYRHRGRRGISQTIIFVLIIVVAIAVAAVVLSRVSFIGQNSSKIGNLIVSRGSLSFDKGTGDIKLSVSVKNDGTGNVTVIKAVVVDANNVPIELLPSNVQGDAIQTASGVIVPPGGKAYIEFTGSNTNAVFIQGNTYDVKISTDSNGPLTTTADAIAVYNSSSSSGGTTGSSSGTQSS